MTESKIVNTRRPRRRLVRLASVAALVATLLTGVASTAGPAPAVSALGNGQVAGWGYATQSSTAYGGVAMRAIDGNVSGDYWKGSTTHTQRELNPWWQVDLGYTFDIKRVEIWGRTDCCADRLRDYWVFTSAYPFPSNDPAVLAQTRGVTATRMTFVPSSNPDYNYQSVSPESMTRFVRIQMIGTDYLSLAEVRVSADTEVVVNEVNYFNLDATVRQSSTAYGGEAEFANDKITDGAFWNRSVTSTDLQGNPWWEADVHTLRHIDRVRIWNRTDCCADRLSNFWVFVSAVPFTSDDPLVLAKQPGVWAVHVTSAPSPVVTLQGLGTGRYVRVQIEGTQYLSLAEVEIGEFFSSTVTPRGVATQSSTGWGGVAERARDDSSSGNWYANSVSSTAPQNNPWWQVDLGSVNVLTEISVSNRTDCCMERLNDYWIFFSATPFTSDDPAVTASQPGVTAYHIMTDPKERLWMHLPGISARYVRLQIPGYGILSLANVGLLRAA